MQGHRIAREIPARQRRWLAAAVLTCAVFAAAWSAGLPSNAGAAPSKQASPQAHKRAKIGCVNSGTAYILYYGSHVTPVGAGVTVAPNGCWNWYDITSVAGAPAWTRCNYPGTVHGSGGTGMYDDTNAHHSGPTDAGAIAACGSPAMFLQYRAARNSAGTCTNTWTAVGTSTIAMRELYCTDASRDSFLITGTNNNAGVINVNPDVPSGDGGSCTFAVSTCRANMHTDIVNYCANTSGFAPTGLYSANGVSASEVNWINSDLNGSCYRMN